MRYLMSVTTAAVVLCGLALHAQAPTAAVRSQAPSSSASQSAPSAPASSAAAAPRASATATATRLGFSAERLKRVDALLQRYVDENKVAGAVALVLKDGQPVYEKAVGWADKEASRKMSMDTIFRIASQTKAITSTAVLMLLEEGRLGLNDPVSKFIPAYAKTTVSVKSPSGVTVVPAKRQITIKDLLTHTAGISYGTGDDIAAQYEAKGLGPAAGFGWYTADKSETVCETMERLASLPFAAQPGEAWVYGYNIDILGCVVEKVSGQGLDVFIKSRILDPLGMKDTHFFLPAEKKNRFAAVYSSADGVITRAPDGGRGQGNYVDGPRRNFAGGAGLLSTVRDYAKFLEMIRQGGVSNGVRLLSPRAVALMHTNEVGTLHSPNGLGFGLGFETTDIAGANNLDPAGSFGWAGAYGSMYRIDPTANIDILLMIQLLPMNTDLNQRFPATVHQAYLGGGERPGGTN